VEPSTPSEIVGVRPVVTGVYLTLRCGACRSRFESYQATVLCVPAGEHRCPACSASVRVGWAELDAALARHLPYREPHEMARLTEEATRVAESWHRSAPFASLLTYRGIDLGPAMERELLATITLGLAQADEDPGGSR
jgi:hypothetical protein